MAYTKRFNIRHKTCGHLFAGRYKTLVVDGSGNGYLRTVCDYVHLNSVRAKLVKADAALESYRGGNGQMQMDARVISVIHREA